MHYNVTSVAVTHLAPHVMQSFKLRLMNFQRYVIQYMLSSEFVKLLSPEIELLMGEKKKAPGAQDVANSKCCKDKLAHFPPARRLQCSLQAAMGRRARGVNQID